MTKQDKTYTRTAPELERKYNLSSFKEALNLATIAKKTAEQAMSIANNLNSSAEEILAEAKGYVDKALEEDSNYPGCYYRIVNGVQEWLNPPMLSGVEYRTTERWLGKPIYQKYIPIGAVQAGSNELPHGISDMTGCIGIQLTDGAHNLITQHPNVQSLYVTVGGIYLTVGEAQTFNATLKYTKS